MSFPLIRPEDAARMPWQVRNRLQQLLAEECAAAAARHEAILAARRRRFFDVPVQADPPAVTAARRVELGETPVQVRALSPSRAAMPLEQLEALRAVQREKKRRQRAAAKAQSVPQRRAS